MPKRKYVPSKSYKRKSTRPYKRYKRSSRPVTYRALNKFYRKRAEKKAFLQEYPFSYSDANGGIACLTNVVQGDSDGQRDGDQLHSLSLYLKGTVQAPNNTSYDYAIFRFIIFQWYEQSVPTVGEILAGFSSVTDYTNRVFLPYSHDNRFRFRVLYDKSFRLFRNDLTGGQNDVEPSFSYKTFGTFIKRIPKRNLQFAGATTTGMNKLYFLNISNLSTLAENKLGYNFMWRFNYTDS